MSLRIERTRDAEALAAAAVDRLEALGHVALRDRGRFLVSLAGGSTPRAVYRRWARTSTLDWGRVVLLFGDERCVPPTAPQSNHRMVQEELLAHLAAPPQVRRMEGEDPDPAAAARRYGQALDELLGPGGRLDVAILGLGEDGHTASLFPRQAALRETVRLCVDTPAPDGKLQRLTLTVPVLRGARELLFLVAGAEKSAIVGEVLDGRLDPERLPAQFFLRDERVEATLMLDAAAAGGIRAR
jgi:6-phosphogluconolactonase